MASVERQGNRHTVRFRFGGRNYRITAGSAKQAKAIAKTVEATLVDVRLGRLNVPEDADVPAFFSSGGQAVLASPQTHGGVSFSQAADDWLASRKTAETTRQGERRHVRYLKEFYGSTGLLKIDAQKYVDSRRVSAATVKKELVTLRGILKYAGRQGHEIPAIRWDHLTLPVETPKERFKPIEKTTDGRRALLDDDDVVDLIETIEASGSRLIVDAVMLVARSGIRRSEVCRLVADDVDVDAATVVITEKKRKHGSTTYRTIPIHPDVLPMLSRRCKDHPTGPLFTASVNTLSDGLQQAVKGTRFDVRGFGWHALRHSMCSRLLDRGVPITTVAGIAGHSTPATTLALYSHEYEARMRDAIRLL